MVKTYRLAHNLSLVDAVPANPGFEGFIGVYVLDDREKAIFDTGPTTSIDNLLTGLRETGVDPADVDYILLSHVHMDHAGGLGTVIKHMPKARVVVHERGAQHLVEPARLYQESLRALGDMALHYGPIEPIPQDRIVIGRTGMVLRTGETELEILETPGHATHHLSYFDRRNNRLYAGELAGVYLRELSVIRPTTPFPFNLEQALDSMDRLISLNAEDLCYAHFGNASNGTPRLRAYKDQLVLWGRTIADCMQRGTSPQAMYEEVRQKDAAIPAIDRLPPAQREREDYFIRNSINGFVSYFERYGTDVLKRV